MKVAIKKCICLLISVIIAFSVFFSLPVTIFAVTTKTGTTGSCKWSFDESTATLTISGNGTMGTYNYNSTFPAWAGDFQIEHLVIEDGVAAITNKAFQGCSALKSVSIGNTVVSIGDNAFDSCSKLTDITIPDNVSTLGKAVFQYCRGLQYVRIGNNIKKINDSTFVYCSNLAYVELPNALTSIGKWAFAECSSLETIIIPENVTVIGDAAFNCAGLTNITLPSSLKKLSGEGTFAACKNLKSVCLPEGLTLIGDSTFSNCESLDNIIIPPNVTALGKYAFSWCTSLGKVNIPNKVKTIGENAFWYCTSLSELSIPNSVTGIGNGAFMDCSSLTSITIPASVTNLGQFSVGYFADPTIKTVDGFIIYGKVGSSAEQYANENGLIFEQMTFGITGDCAWSLNGTVLTISGNGQTEYFSSSSEAPWDLSITEIIIEEGVNSIQGGAFFKDLPNLKSVYMPDSIKFLYDGIFSDYDNDVVFYCSSESYASRYASSHSGVVAKYTSGSSGNCNWYLNGTILTIYGDGPMENYQSYYIPWGNDITKVIIEDGVTSIGNYSFYRCNKIISVTIPKTIETIGIYAFYDTSISNISLPTSLRIIDRGAFQNCKYIENVEIPEGVTNINMDAFDYCDKLKNVTIPSSVTVIADGAFKRCKSLTTINVSENNTAYASIDGNLYNKNITNLIQYAIAKKEKSYVLPNSIRKIEKFAFYVCDNLESVSIPDGFTFIGDYSFSDFYSLKNITIPETVTGIGTSAFYGCTNLVNIFYNGCEHTWSNIVINKNNTPLTNSEIHYTVPFSIEPDIGYPNTCTENGLTEGSHCSKCRKTIVAQEIIPATGHTVVIDKAKAPTCTETGLTEGSHCSVCGEVIKAQSVIPATEHTEVIDKGKAPTCTETGLTDGSHCSVCGEVIKAQGIIPAKGHTPVTDKGYPATLSSTGLTDGSHCSVCGKVLEQQKEIPVLEYVMVVVGSTSEIFGTKWDDFNYDNIMTENSDGSYTLEYTVNKAYKEVQIMVAKLSKEDYIRYGDENRNIVSFSLTGTGTFTVTATPSANGYIVSVAGGNVKIITDLEYSAVYAVGNGEGAWLNGVTWNPCDKNNSMTEISDDVWEIEYKNVSAGSHQLKFAIDGDWMHNFGGVFNNSSVVTDAVYNGDNILFETKGLCTVKVQLDLRNFNFRTKQGAKFTITIICYHDSIKTEKGYSADCTHDGLTDSEICEICGTVLVEHKVIPAKGHTEVIDKGKAPTCTETGLTDGSHCSVCGEIIKAQEVIPATGHTKVIDKGKAPTCTETGLTDGSHCSVCGEIIKAQEVIPATGHTWDNGTVTKAADCHHEGEMTYRCSECHEKRTEVIPMLEHQWDDGTITKEPTYTEPGEVKYTCSLCGDTRTEPVPCKEKKGKLTISNETVRAGDEVTVKLYLDENPGITALSINVNFPNRFILKDVQYMGLFPNQPSSSPMNYNPFTISWASPTSTDIDNTGLFAVLTFNVGIDVPLADYPITVSYNAENVFDSAFVNVPLDIENGTVSVLKPTPGDVNRDGNINMKDLVLIQQLINRWDVQIVESAADVTDDGEINMKDLVLLQRYINGWEVVLK